MLNTAKKNITKWEHIECEVKKVGLDIVKFKIDYEGKAKELFEEDLKLCRELGVRGFPTMFFTDTTGSKEIVYGSKPYETFENALLKVFPAASRTTYDKTWHSVFSQYHSLTVKEFSVLTGKERNESEKYLNDLKAKGHLEKGQQKTELFGC